MPRKSKIHRDDLSIIRSAATGEGCVRITSLKQLQDLQDGAIRARDFFRDLTKGMTIEHAKVIRSLRVDDHCTWRSVAQECYNREMFSTDGWVPPSNQIMGVVLCERAAKLLGEDHMAHPWN